MQTENWFYRFKYLLLQSMSIGNYRYIPDCENGINMNIELHPEHTKRISYL